MFNGTLNGRSSGNGIYASPVLTGAPNVRLGLVPVVRNLGKMSGSASPLAALRRPPLLSLGASSGLSSLSSWSARRLSPFGRRAAAATSVAAFARFAVPARLRRPPSP